MIFRLGLVSFLERLVMVNNLTYLHIVSQVHIDLNTGIRGKPAHKHVTACAIVYPSRHLAQQLLSHWKSKVNSISPGKQFSKWDSSTIHE